MKLILWPYLFKLFCTSQLFWCVNFAATCQEHCWVCCFPLVSVLLMSNFQDDKCFISPLWSDTLTGAKQQPLLSYSACDWCEINWSEQTTQNKTQHLATHSAFCKIVYVCASLILSPQKGKENDKQITSYLIILYSKTYRCALWRSYRLRVYTSQHAKHCHLFLRTSLPQVLWLKCIMYGYNISTNLIQFILVLCANIHSTVIYLWKASVTENVPVDMTVKA